MSRIKKLSLLGLAVLALAWAPTMAAADDGRVTVQPAVLQSSGDAVGGATVQTVRWGRWGGGVWFGGPAYYGGWYRPYYYRGFYPGYYAYPAYGYGYYPYGGVYYTWW